MKKLLFLIFLVLSTGRVHATLIDSLHVTPSIDEQTFKNGTLDITFWNQGNSMVTYCLMDADGEVGPVRLSGGSREPSRARLLWRARPFLDHGYHGLRPCVSAGVRR